MSSNKKFYKVTKANAEIIDKYLDYYKTKKANLSERSLRNIKETLKKLADFLKSKSLEKATEQDLIDFFSNKERVTIGSRDTYANHMIPFYRYIEHADKHSRPTNMKWFDFTTAREKRKMIKPNKKQEQFITSDEYNKIVSYQYDRFGQT
ncbi:MAG: site-specific integrase, partial [Thermoplasmatales archaeon]|nr:site-specific integrase [Thermoplasmatales archaeon]